MMLVDLKPLFARLNPLCTAAVESAAGLTLARGHYEISIEHVLHRLVGESGSDLHLILGHGQVDAVRLAAQLEDALARMKNGNPGRPVFSPLLTEWLQDGWLMASVALGEQHVRSGALLLALLARPGYYAAGTPWGDSLQGIAREELQRQFESWTQGSTEQTFESRRPSAGGSQAGASDTSALTRFCEDYTAKAAQGQIDPVFGRDDEIRQMIDVLARRRKNNPICVGEPGVGKTAVVEGLALRIVQADVPDFLRDTRLLGLDLGLLEAGASVKGEFEQRLRGVIDAIKASPQPIILFVDEAHMLIGAGGASGGSDAANLLKPALARGELRTIAATTWGEYKKYFERDPALTRRFQLIKLDEPDSATAVQILRGLKSRYEAVHGVSVRDDALQAAALLSERYITGRQLPDKAVDLLDTAAARVRISLGVKPAQMQRIDYVLAGLEREREALERDQAHGHAIDARRLAQIALDVQHEQDALQTLNARWQAEQAAARKVLDLRQQLALQQEGDDASRDAALLQSLALELAQAREQLQALQGDAPLVFTEVGPDTVAQVVSDWTGVPLGKMQREGAGAILGLAGQLRERISGQDEALEQIAQVLKAAQSGLRDPRQPLGVFLLAGPSGVGKTETALTVADEVFGGEHALTTINMSEFQEKHTVSRLVGSPPGYVGYGEGGVLTEAVRKRPYSVVLLDEVEKAHLDVVNLFYQVFDKGSLADGEGRAIDFSNTVIFLTSNLASEEITAARAENPPPSSDALAERIRPILSRHFKPALLARMTVVPYATLSDQALALIARQKLQLMAQRLHSGSGVTLNISDEVVQAIAQRCTEVDSGARNIDFILRKSLLPVLSDHVLAWMADGGGSAVLNVAYDAQADQPWLIHMEAGDVE